METYTPKGICSKLMTYNIVDGCITDLKIERGCDGNNQAVCRLVEGQSIDKIVKMLSGIDCNGKGTSCADQLSTALARHL